MSSREKILKEIAQNKPAEVPLPSSFSFERTEEAPLAKFLQVLQAIGGNGKVVDNWNDVQQHLQQQLESRMEVVNGIPELSPCTIQEYALKEGAELQNVHTVFLKGETAVGENAAIWVSEQAMVNRMLPFICEQLVLVVKEETVVANMHEAYANVQVADGGYGVFIAGPSKTADIEQSLVIGAHGPLALQVFVLSTSPKPSPAKQ
ncbi:MAG TPA: LUD domain-containing protein [Flavisolibacter sp.]|nr:LUD domain-containing protein [Flavisolibacter sp.]